MGIGGITPLLLNLGIGSRSVGSLTFRTLFPSVRAPNNHRGAPIPVKKFQGTDKISRLSPDFNFSYLYSVLSFAVSFNFHISTALDGLASSLWFQDHTQTHNCR